MRRRTFLGALGVGGIGLAAGAWLRPRAARAELPANDRRVVVNLMLRGGPDFRHIIVPPFAGESSGPGFLYWSNRWRSHGLGQDPEDWQRRYASDFVPVQIGGRTLGIWKDAGWLRAQIAAGKAALIHNVVGATSRDHSHAELVWESGARATTPNDFTRDGWGGRLAQDLGGRVVSMTSPVRLFCNGRHASDPHLHDNAHVITASDTRDIALHRPEVLATEPASRGAAAVLSRGLTSYYAALGPELPETSPFARTVQHERTLRAFGDAVQARLSTVPEPASLTALYDGDATLSSRAFGRQVRNLHDSFACSDIFSFRVGSLVYGGFDTHRDQLSTVEPQFKDIFGAEAGLATLYDALAATMPDALSNMVLVIGGEFGRQLAANGDEGTDHGRGNTVLVIGEAVRGGIYGEPFPEDEAHARQPGTDIVGKTTVESVYGAICDWVDPGLGASVFPPEPGAAVEDGVDLGALFSG